MRMRMSSKIFSLAFLAALAIGPHLHAAAPGNAEQEYQVARKIALRDPKVRSAYEEADRKLEEKILQIDPALADYVHHRSTEPGGFHAAKKTEAHHKSAATPAPTSEGTTYVIKSGDTLGAIASHYGVTVTALKSANHIADEKKLAVGQELKIPSK